MKPTFKRVFLAVAVAAFVLALAGPVLAASVWSPTILRYQEQGSGKVSRVYTVTMTSAADGTCSGAGPAISAYVVRVTTNPTGTMTAGDEWDLTLLDEDGVDILGNNADNSIVGSGYNRDDDISEQTFPLYPDGATYGPVRVHGTLNATGASMGNAQVCVVKIYTVE